MEATLKDPGYLGSISVSGAANLKSLLAAAAEPGSRAAFYLVYMAYAIHARSPGFRPADMLVGKALQRYSDLTTRGCWDYAYASFLDIHGETIVRRGWDEAPAARRFFAANELGVAPVRGPLLVLIGEADEAVPFPLLKEVVKSACRNGIALSFHSYPGLEHDPTMDKSTPDQLAWVRERFASRPFASNCASLPP